MDKNKIIPITFLLGVFLMVGLVSAANTVTLTRPAQDASISGSSYVLNATLDTNTLNFTYATFFYDDGSSNTTITANATNVTNTLFNTTWDTTAIVDVDDLIIWVEVTNETYAVQTRDSSTGVDVDNGNPTSTISSATFGSGSNINFGSTYTIGIDADSTIGISSCLVHYTDRVTSVVSTQSITPSANACSASTTPESQSLQKGSSYDVLVQATDGNGDQTNSSSRILRVPNTGGGGGGGSSTGVQKAINNVAQGTSGVKAIVSSLLEKINSFINSIKGLFN